jgi:SMP-30/Gluconolactonase/LRE-like region
MDEGFVVSNGIAWSPDDRTMYFADSRAEPVWAYDFGAEEGAIRNRRVSTREIEGRCDARPSMRRVFIGARSSMAARSRVSTRPGSSTGSSRCR